MMIKQYDFFRTKYGEELLIDVIRLEDLERYVLETPVQRLSYYDITVISDGRGSFSLDHLEYPIMRGSVLFTSPGQVRKWNTTEVPQGYVVIFEDEFLLTFFNDTRFVRELSFFHHPNPLRLDDADFNLVVDLLRNIEREISISGSDKHMLRALLYQLLIFFKRKLPGSIPANRYINNFIQLVDDHHTSHRSVNYYADALHITPGHLNSIVRESLNVSAKEYILTRNILEAKRLLQYTELTIDEIASKLNYRTTTYFVRKFHMHVGVTPLHFRKNR